MRRSRLSIILVLLSTVLITTVALTYYKPKTIEDIVKEQGCSSYKIVNKPRKNTARTFMEIGSKKALLCYKYEVVCGYTLCMNVKSLCYRGGWICTTVKKCYFVFKS